MIVKLVTFSFQNTKGTYIYNPDMIEIRGQSNALGMAPNANLPADLIGVQTDMEIFNPYTGVSAWQALNPGVNSQGSPNTNGTDSATFGFESRLLKLLRDARNKPQRLIKYAVSNTYLAAQGAGVFDWSTSSTNEWYKLSNDNATLARSTMADTRPPRVFIWDQGENDAAGSTTANAYQTNLEAFIAAIRTYYGWPQMPFIIVRMGTAQTLNAFISTVQAKQDAVALQANNYIVSTEGLTTVGDNIHWNAASVETIAQRIFTVMTNNNL